MNTSILKTDRATAQSIKLAKILTYCGAIPFLFAALLSLSQYIQLPDSLGGNISFAAYKAKALMHTYAVVIVSFVAGIQWGVFLQNSSYMIFLIISNILTLLAWFSLMILAQKMALILLLCCFICALLTDLNAYKHKLIPDWFWQLRKSITALVSAAFIIVILST